jgi:hypothetical protein
MEFEGFKAGGVPQQDAKAVQVNSAIGHEAFSPVDNMRLGVRNKPHKIFDFVGDAVPPWNPSERFPQLAGGIEFESNFQREVKAKSQCMSP